MGVDLVCTWGGVFMLFTVRLLLAVPVYEWFPGIL